MAIKNKNSSNGYFQKTFQHLLNDNLWLQTYKTIFFMNCFFIGVQLVCGNGLVLHTSDEYL